MFSLGYFAGICVLPGGGVRERDSLQCGRESSLRQLSESPLADVVSTRVACMAVALSLAQGAGGPVPRTVKVDIGGEAEREFTAALNELYSLLAPLTMASVAGRVGVSEPAVSHWLHGRRAPQERSLARLYSEAVKVALATGRTVPYRLDQLIDMRHGSLLRPLGLQGSTCRHVGIDGGGPAQQGASTGR